MEDGTNHYGRETGGGRNPQKSPGKVRREGTDPGTFLVGDNPAAHVYKRSLLKTAASLGIHTRDVELPEGASQEEAERALRALSEDSRVDGILPLVPFPRHISRMQLIQQLDPEKDMDCIHPINGGKLYLGITPWGPCTPRSCMALLDYYKIPWKGSMW